MARDMGQSSQRPVVHLPELPTQDEISRKQKRARTISPWPEQHHTTKELFKPESSAIEKAATAPGICETGYQKSTEQQDVTFCNQFASPMLLGTEDMESGLLHRSATSNKAAMHSVIKQAAARKTSAGKEAKGEPLSRRQPGLGFIYRLPKLRWKRAMDSALDKTPMRSMLSHFSPSRFQRVFLDHSAVCQTYSARDLVSGAVVQEVIEDDCGHQMPDLLLPVNAAALDTVWVEIQQKDAALQQDLSQFSHQPYHQISCGCHTSEMPHVGCVVSSSATEDAKLIAIVTGVQFCPFRVDLC